MEKEDVKKFRSHYFPTASIETSRHLMCEKFKDYGLTERTARNWESGQRKISQWFVKVSGDFDKDGILKKEK